MTVSFQTLEKFGNVLTVRGKPHSMNIAITLAGVEFPEKDVRGTPMLTFCCTV